MKRINCLRWIALLAVSSAFVGCESKPANNAAKPTAAPKFMLAWSEYPSWSIFGVAERRGTYRWAKLAKWALSKKDNITLTSSLSSLTTTVASPFTATPKPMRSVSPTSTSSVRLPRERALQSCRPRPQTGLMLALLPESTQSMLWRASRRYGLEKSVSQYCFDRCLVKLDKDPAKFPFLNMAPEQASQAFEQKTGNIQSIMVWNPYVMQSLARRPDAKVLFDSSAIPEEIIDMVVVGADSLKKPGGKDFAAAILETFYAMNKRMTDPATSDKTLMGIGARFAKLELVDMKKGRHANPILWRTSRGDRFVWKRQSSARKPCQSSSASFVRSMV